MLNKIIVIFVFHAYDICHAYRPGSEWVSQHTLSINGKRNGISREDRVAVGRSISNKNTEQIIDEINDKVQQWNFYADKAGVDKEKKITIGETLNSKI